MPPMKRYPSKRCLRFKSPAVRALVLVSVIFVSVSASPVVAADPLSQLVNEKAGVYLEASDLNGHLKTISDFSSGQSISAHSCISVMAGESGCQKSQTGIARY